MVSVRLAEQICRNLSEAKRRTVLDLSFDWLRATMGLPCRGVQGRPYTPDEADAIAVEAGNQVLYAACPFGAGLECLLTPEDMGPQWNPASESNSAPYCWLPTGIARTLDQPRLAVDLRLGLIPDAKAALLSRNQSLERPDNYRASQLMTPEDEDWLQWGLKRYNPEELELAIKGRYRAITK